MNADVPAGNGAPPLDTTAEKNPHETSSQLMAFPLSNELNSVNSASIERLSENRLKFG